jgi:hypothetical protein
MSKAFSKQDNGGGAFAEAMHRAVDGERRSKEDRAARYQQSLGTSLPKRALSADGPNADLRRLTRFCARRARTSNTSPAGLSVRAPR